MIYHLKYNSSLNIWLSVLRQSTNNRIQSLNNWISIRSAFSFMHIRNNQLQKKNRGAKIRMTNIATIKFMIGIYTFFIRIKLIQFFKNFNINYPIKT